MAINYYEKEGKYPRLYLPSEDKATIADTIVFSEAYFTIAKDSIRIVGSLAKGSTGIEKWGEKDWKPEGRKCVLDVFEKEKDARNADGKWEKQPVSKSENYLFCRLKADLSNVPNDSCVSILFRPFVYPQFLEKYTPEGLLPMSEPEIRIYEGMVKDLTFVSHIAEPKGLLNEEDKKQLAEAGKSSGSKGNGNYKPAETETEKLRARMDFLIEQLASCGEPKSLRDVAAILSAQPTDELASSELAIFAATVDLIFRLFD